MIKHTIFTGMVMITLLATGYANEPIFFNVKEYGARADGKTLDGKAINAAISAAAQKGGGTVFFPAGNYLTGSIHLESNITL
jgi:polygalacturonase